MAEWKEEKKKFLDRLLEDIEIGYVDEDIIGLLKLFFKLPYAFTKSSCSGRITAVDAKFPWSRDGSIVFKVHRPITEDELFKIISKPVKERLWLNVQGPIIHVVAKDLDSAKKILELARKAGFKHSGILVLDEHPLVELTTGVRANILLKIGERLVIDPSPEVVDIINEVLLEGKRRLRRLEEVLEEELSSLERGIKLVETSEGARGQVREVGQRGENLSSKGNKVDEEGRNEGELEKDKEMGSRRVREVNSVARG